MTFLDWLAALANTIFLVSYVEFVAHIFKTRSVEGVSPRALWMWLAGFLLLFIHFLANKSLLFAPYYFFGTVLSITALIGWRRYR